MKLDFEESQECAEWLCEVPLSHFDPFGKGVLTMSIEDVDDVDPSLGAFVDEFVERYREFWPHIEELLLGWGWSRDELSEAHERTRIELEDGSRNPPESWELNFCFLFDNGHTLDLGLAFDGWVPDDRLVGSH